ncbi:TPA: GTPase family protein [Serratia fonticola]|uniref:GTPase family protein n=1 Tax=Serratia fonticola TaxID=47917 RepID=UPI0034C60256
MEDKAKTGYKLVKDAVDILPVGLRKRVLSKLDEIVGYEPRIGIMGKTGAGKSSLCNAIFKGEECPVSDVGACTREIKEIRIQFGKRSIYLVDIPGVGENAERDSEYEKLYRELMPKLDLILWVIKGDDRAFSADEHFYKDVLIPAGGKEKTLFVLNQVDKIEPFREWDVQNGCPSPQQMKNITEKKDYISERFGFTDHPIVAIAASEGYNVTYLVEEMVRALPKHARSPIAAQVKEEHKTEKVIEDATNGFGDTVDRVIDEIIDMAPIPKPIATLAKAAKKLVVEGFKKAWGFFFG